MDSEDQKTETPPQVGQHPAQASQNEEPGLNSDSADRVDNHNEMMKEEEEERICRYCFCGTEDGELISPCDCKGGQKYVHLTCLRRWQRMVLVSQPTHPAFYEDDIRHHKCSVCQAKFTCAPPSRHELMASFTGPEIAGLIDVGCVIVSEDRFSQEIDRLTVDNPWERGMLHWRRGVYLITSVKELDKGLSLVCTSKRMLDNVRSGIAPDLTMQLPSGDGMKGKLVARGALEGVSESQLYERLQSLQEVPAELCLEIEEHNAGNDHISAVNLTRTYSGPLNSRLVDKAMKDVTSKYPGASQVSISHYNGGPCEDSQICACIVLGGTGKGWTILKSLTRAIETAYSRAVHRFAEQGEIHGGQTVRIQNLKSAQQLNGEVGIALGFDTKSGRWMVRLRNGDGKKVKPVNLEPLEGKHGRVFVFWGDARWSRAQLLGEIARGHWGLCHATTHELVQAPSKRWHPSMEGRLAFAPVTEMTDKSLFQMNAARNDARAVAAAFPDEDEDDNNDDD